MDPSHRPTVHGANHGQFGRSHLLDQVSRLLKHPPMLRNVIINRLEVPGLFSSALLPIPGIKPITMPVHRFKAPVWLRVGAFPPGHLQNTDRAFCTIVLRLQDEPTGTKTTFCYQKLQFIMFYSSSAGNVQRPNTNNSICASSGEVDSAESFADRAGIPVPMTIEASSSLFLHHRRSGIPLQVQLGP